MGWMMCWMMVRSRQLEGTRAIQPSHILVEADLSITIGIEVGETSIDRLGGQSLLDQQGMESRKLLGIQYTRTIGVEALELLGGHDETLELLVRELDRTESIGTIPPGRELLLVDLARAIGVDDLESHLKLGVAEEVAEIVAEELELLVVDRARAIGVVSGWCGWDGMDGYVSECV